MLKHRVCVDNQLADALSRKIALLHSMYVKVTGFKRLKEEYETCQTSGISIPPSRVNHH